MQPFIDQCSRLGAPDGFDFRGPQDTEPMALFLPREDVAARRPASPEHDAGGSAPATITHDETFEGW